jgi:glycogen synthase
MRICFVTPEVFAWGYHGGFGFITRTLGRELAKRGHEVSVVTPEGVSRWRSRRLTA